MQFTYKKATIEDINILVETRIEVLRAANKLDAAADMKEVEKQSYEYYKNSLKENTHTAYLVYCGDKFIGAGGISYFRVMPAYYNPTGYKAYIMNMYTVSEYRRKGVA